MTALSFYLACCAFLAASASARHLHRPQIHHHEHQRRQAVTARSISTSGKVSPSLVEAPAASITAGNDAIADIQQVQEGLSDLPANLLSFVQAAEAQLADMASMLSELMGSSATAVSPTGQPTTPPGVQITTPSWSQAPIPLSSSASSPIFPPIPSFASTGALNTSQATILQTSRFTSTRIRTTTLPFGGPTMISSLPSGLPLASGNWTLPYPTGGRPAIAPSIARTASPAPPAPTTWPQ